MDYPDDEWQRKGATLSDKTARQEFGLTQDERHLTDDNAPPATPRRHSHAAPPGGWPDVAGEQDPP
jgi:hypothetical protein